MSAAASFATPGGMSSPPILSPNPAPSLFSTHGGSGPSGWTAFLEAENLRAEREKSREPERKPHKDKKSKNYKQRSKELTKSINNSGWRPPRDSYQAEWPH